MTSVRIYADIFKRIQRYTIKPIGIILDRHAPPPTGEPTIDPEGEWMKCDQLNNIIAMGGLIQHNPELEELLLDGQAQRSLINTLTGMGYTDFDQVIKVLRDQRTTVLSQREFEVWMEGWQDNGGIQTAQLLGKGVGYSFSEAVADLKEKLGRKAKDWRHDVVKNKWSDYGCDFYDNEKDARAFVG